MHGHGRSTDLLSHADIHLYGRTGLVLRALIIVQTIIHHHSKVFTTGQARVNAEHYVIKCVGGQ